MLDIKNLHKRYATGDPALRGVSLSVPAGEVLGLIGPSGAGKSTLIRCINRLVEPTEGQILLNGKDLAHIGRHGLRMARREIGMIFQEYALVERLTVMENLLSGRLGYTRFWPSWFRRFSSEDIRLAYSLLERVGLARLENKRADALSGGQRQRVGIARALMQRPALLLIDEPTASLDPKTSRQIMRLILALCTEHKLAAIINIHDVVLATEFLPRIVGLRQGMMVYDGPATQMDHKVLTDIYGDEDWSNITDRMANKSTGVKAHPDQAPLLAAAG